MKFPILQSQLLSMYGEPRDPADYLKIMDFGEFASHFRHVRNYEGAPWSCRIYGHYLLEAPLRAAFKLLVEGGLTVELKTFDGCLNIRRPTAGGLRYSTHAWGISVDFNAGSNPYGRKPTISPGLAKCFTRCGFEWGGLWRSADNNPYAACDGMHFQLAWTRVRTDGNPLNPNAWNGVVALEPEDLFPAKPAAPIILPGSYKVLAKPFVNIRLGPGTDFEDLGDVPVGEIITPIDTKGWVAFLLDDNTIGWIAEQYLKKVS